jgi:hypothetical protein
MQMDQFIQRNEIGDKVTTSFIADDPTKAAEIFLNTFKSKEIAGVNDIVMFDYYVYNNLMFKPEKKNNKLNFVEIAFISTFSANIQKMVAWESIYDKQVEFYLKDDLCSLQFYDLKEAQLKELSKKISDCKTKYVGIAICTKILHLKYPYTIPILDSYVQSYYGSQDENKLIDVIHFDLCNLRSGSKYIQFEDSFKNQLNDLVKKDTKLGMGYVDISAIRIFDLLIWDYVNKGCLPGIWIEKTLWGIIHKKKQQTRHDFKKSAGGLPINVRSESYIKEKKSWNKRDVVIISSSSEYEFEGNIKPPKIITVNKEDEFSAETISNKLKEILTKPL